MSKKHFIELADCLRTLTFVYKDRPQGAVPQEALLRTLADFCQSQNPKFDRARWLGYIAGANGPNGGAK